MAWTTTTDLAEYERAAGAFARSLPVEHTTVLSIADRLRQQGNDAFGDRAPEFGWWSPNGSAVTAAFVRTPPHRLLLTPLPDAATALLAAHYAEHDPQLPGVVSAVPTAHAFARAWSSATGAAFTPHRRAERLYRLGQLEPPRTVHGERGRVAGAHDRELLTGWYTQFARAIGEPDPPDPGRWVDGRLAYGGLAL
ncbi:hypothetical protein [Streptomyces humicola]|uniref:hypothetical protein n=1 Tax=Streptomyces humicola TaxID=2953240 RepID=UPI0027E2705A|nr:hypothetical protein [Streptomyces humicola]